jgi:hypothetical protein
MTLVAGTLIDGAKQLAYPVVGPVNVSDAALLQYLNVLDDEIVTLVFQTARWILRENGAIITIDEDLNEIGYILEDALGYGDFTYHNFQTKDAMPLPIAQEADLHKQVGNPRAVITQTEQGPTLVPIDPHRQNWETADERIFWTQDGDTVTYTYIPMPGGMTALTDELVSPDFARMFFKQALALQIFMMNPTVPDNTIQLALARESNLKRQLTLQIYKYAPIQSRIGE